MVKGDKKRRPDDPSAGGKRSAMAPEEDPGGVARDGPALASGPTGLKARGPGADTGAGAEGATDAKDDGGPRGGLARVTHTKDQCR